MGAKKGDIKSEISREAGTNCLTPPHPIPFAGPLCALTLILSWPHPTVTVLTSTCCLCPHSRTYGAGKGRREEGDREGRKEGGFLQPRKQNRERRGKKKHRSGGGG